MKAKLIIDSTIKKMFTILNSLSDIKARFNQDNLMFASNDDGQYRAYFLIIDRKSFLDYDVEDDIRFEIDFDNKFLIKKIITAKGNGTLYAVSSGGTIKLEFHDYTTNEYSHYTFDIDDNLRFLKILAAKFPSHVSLSTSALSTVVNRLEKESIFVENTNKSLNFKIDDDDKQISQKINYTPFSQDVFSWYSPETFATRIRIRYLKAIAKYIQWSSTIRIDIGEQIPMILSQTFGLQNKFLYVIANMKIVTENK